MDGMGKKKGSMIFANQPFRTPMGCFPKYILFEVPIHQFTLRGATKFGKSKPFLLTSPAKFVKVP